MSYDDDFKAFFGAIFWGHKRISIRPARWDKFSSSLFRLGLISRPYNFRPVVG